MDDRLVEIPVAKWSDLRDLYLRDWPRHMLGYQTINTFLSWMNQQRIDHLSVFSLNDDWSDGTFLCLHRYVCFANTVSDSSERLKQLLSIFNWNMYLEDSPVMRRHYPTVTENLSDKNFNPSFEIPSALYFMPCEKALHLNINVPPTYALKRLTEDRAEEINEAWPHKHYGSLIMIRQYIRLNPSIGAFCPEGNLIANVLLSNCGAHSMVQVNPKYLRQGWASLVCKALAKELATRGQDSYACIVTGNQSSIAMFEKIGFEAIDEVMWFGIDTPGGDDFDWEAY